jgi:signal transduction histidine kinase
VRKDVKRLTQTIEPETKIKRAKLDSQVPTTLPAPAAPSQRSRSPQLPHTVCAPACIDATMPTHTAEEASASSIPSPAYMQEFFYNTPSALIVVGKQFEVRDLNPAALTKLGLTLDEAHTRTCQDILMCRNANSTLLCGTSHCPLVRVLQQGETISGTELFLGTQPTHSTEYSVNITPITIQSEPAIIFAARDISTLKVANQVRANFVSMVSHELRTPLNSVHGFVDLMLQGHMGALSEEQHKYLGYTQEGVQQLMAIVEDILFMTRSDSGQFEVKPQKVNARVLAKQVVTSLRLQAIRAAVILDKDIPTPTPDIYADPQRMKQVLNNLVTNAIKFTPPSGTVTIRVRVQEDNMVRFSVIDTGYGIPPEDQPHVFERFYQSNHALQSKMGGYGLGLSIARLIVIQHGGEISFESIPLYNLEDESPHGTTFSFTAPLYTGQDQEEHT